MSALRIAVIGPESSGKSILCEQLAAQYKTVCIQEYARKYLGEINRVYSIEDIVTIYREQFKLEEIAFNNNHKMIFIDTEFIIAKVWCEHVFGRCPEYIEEMLKLHPYDYYLLTSPDLPWEYDPLRENPGKSDFFFNWYKSILETNNLNFGIVSGTGDQRLVNAIARVDEFLITKSGKTKA